MEMKRREDIICSTRIHDLKGVQIKFILLNPRSHSAVLTGSVWIAPISLLIFLLETSASFISLKSLYSCFKSLVYGEKKNYCMPASVHFPHILVRQSKAKRLATKC